MPENQTDFVAGIYYRLQELEKHYGRVDQLEKELDELAWRLDTLENARQEETENG